MALEAGSVYAVLGGKFMPTGFAQFDAAMKKSVASASAAEAGIVGSSNRSSRAMTALGTAAKGGAAVGLIAVGVAAAKSVQHARSFEKEMRNVNSIAGLNEKQFNKLSASVLKLSGKTAQAPVTLAKGVYDLVSSGFSASESLIILESSAKAASAGLTTTETATAAVAAVLNAYKRPASDAAEVSDDLFQTVNLGVITFEELASSIGDALPFAQSIGVGLKDVGAATSTMTKAGISAPETMTRIKGALVAMLKPSEAMQGAFKKLGVASGEELVKKTGSFQGALQALTGTVGNNKEEVAKLFPDIRAMGAALLLTGRNAKSANSDLAGFKNTSGATDAVLKEQKKSLDFQAKQLSANFQALAVQIGNELTPALTKAATAMNDFFDQLRSGEGIGGAIGKVLKTIGVGIAAIGGSRAAIANFSQLFPPSMVSGALSVLGVIRALISGFLSLASVGARLPGPLSAPYKVLGQSAKMALDDIDRVTGSLRKGLQQNQPKLKIVAENQDAVRKIQQIERSKIAPKVAKILGKDTDAKSKIQALIKLGIPEKIATVLASTGSARGAIAQLRQEMAAITSKTVTITVRRVGDAVGGTARAAGRGAGGAETALVGEGGGPEYIVDTATGRSRRVDSAQVVDLKPTEYVIPTESRYRGRALGLIAEMAQDMGLVGYAKGRKGKKKESAKERKKRREREDRRMGIADTNAGRLGTEMDTAQIEGKQKAWEEARKKRLKALNTHLGRVTAARKRTKPGSQRYTELSAKASEIRNAIARTKSETYQVDPLDTGLTDGEQDQIDALDAAIALAALTEGTGDDLSALQGKAGVLAGMLESARTSGRPSRVITELAGQLKSTRDDISSLTGQAAGTPDTAGPTADQQAESDQKMNRDRINAQSAFIDRLVGATIGGAGNTLVFQSYVPPSPTEAKRLADYTVGGIGYQGGVPSSRESVGV